MVRRASRYLMTRVEQALIAFACWWGACTGQLKGQAVAIDTVAMRQLAAFWAGQPGDSLACLYGHTEGDLLVIDSTSNLVAACGPGVGAMGFLRGDYREADVLAGLAAVLVIREDWRFAGEVYGVVPVFLPDGRRVKAPRVWWAIRP